MNRDLSTANISSYLWTFTMFSLLCHCSQIYYTHCTHRSKVNPVNTVVIFNKRRISNWDSIMGKFKRVCWGLAVIDSNYSSVRFAILFQNFKLLSQIASFSNRAIQLVPGNLGPDIWFQATWGQTFGSRQPGGQTFGSRQPGARPLVPGSLEPDLWFQTAWGRIFGSRQPGANLWFQATIDVLWVL